LKISKQKSESITITVLLHDCVSNYIHGNRVGPIQIP
jgi:hypothetical protein